MNAQFFELIKTHGVMGIIRANSVEDAILAAKAAYDGGIRIVELTMTTPDAISAMQEVRRQYGAEVLVGMGTVLELAQARNAILGSAQFIVSPVTDTDIVALCNSYNVCIIPGAFTPTEVFRAWKLGPDAVKVFPCSSVGPSHIRELKAPFPDIPMIPTGGVNEHTASDFIKAGACAVGVGSAIFNAEAIAAGNFAELTKRARKVVAAVEAARKK